MSFSPWLMVVLAAFNSCFGNYFLKKSSSIPEQGILEQLVNINFILGIFLYGINVLFFAYALKFLSVSIAYPVLSVLSFTFLIIISNFFLGESLSSKQVLGIFLSLFAVFLLAGE